MDAVKFVAARRRMFAMTVVRCKECKHLKTPRCPNGKPTCEKHGREVIAQIDYCSWGERRG